MQDTATADMRKGRIIKNGAKGNLTIFQAQQSTKKSSNAENVTRPTLFRMPCLILQQNLAKVNQYSLPNTGKLSIFKYF